MLPHGVQKHGVTKVLPLSTNGLIGEINGVDRGLVHGVVHGPVVGMVHADLTDLDQMVKVAVDGIMAPTALVTVMVIMMGKANKNDFTVSAQHIDFNFIHFSKYVAANRGSVHVAPLVGHIQSVSSKNLEPAPGTTW